MNKQKELSIEDLPGVGAATAEKLRDAGYNNLMSVAVASPGELVECAGVGEAAARKMINTARNNLDMGFTSGAELLEKRKNIIRIPTGSKSFDAMINGGMESGGITECYGQFGSGKSALAHQLAINGLFLDENNEPTSFVIWIDSENTFRPERIKEICENNNLDPMKVLKSIKVVRAFNSDHQMMCAEKVEDLIEKEQLNVKLIIVDSLMTHFRSEFCVTPDMDVIGNPSAKKITQFQPGNKVLTHKGKFAKVLSTSELDYEGKIMKIKPTYSTPFTLTPDHSVLALKSIRKTWYKNSTKYNLKDEKNYSKIINSKNHYKLIEGYGPDWIMAGTLEKGDYLVYPIIQSITDKENILIKEYLSKNYFEFEDKIKANNYFHDLKTYEAVIAEYKTGKKITKIANEYKLPLSTISQWTNNKQNLKEDIIDLPQQIKIDKKSMKLFGYFLAKGHVNDHQVIFTFHKKEYINDVKNLMKKVFCIKVNKGFIQENAHRVVFSSILLANFFENIFGREALNKNMPMWMMYLPIEKQIEIVKGYWRVDGCKSNNGFRFDTTSRLLAEQIRQILMRMQILPSFRIDRNYRKNEKYIIEVFGKQVEVFAKFFEEEHEIINKRTFSYNRGWVEKDYAFLPIENIEDFYYKGKVNNLEIEGDHSYALSSAVVHNCGRGTLADRQQKINKHMHALMKIADQYNLCVYVTNQVMAKPDTFFGDPTVPIGGNIVGHNSSTRIYLRRGKGDTRVAKLVDSPYLADGESIFRITEKGIADVK